MSWWPPHLEVTLDCPLHQRHHLGLGPITSRQATPSLASRPTLLLLPVPPPQSQWAELLSPPHMPFRLPLPESFTTPDRLCHLLPALPRLISQLHTHCWPCLEWSPWASGPKQSWCPVYSPQCSVAFPSQPGWAQGAPGLSEDSQCLMVSEPGPAQSGHTSTWVIKRPRMPWSGGGGEYGNWDTAKATPMWDTRTPLPHPNPTGSKSISISMAATPSLPVPGHLPPLGSPARAGPCGLFSTSSYRIWSSHTLVYGHTSQE